MLLADFYYKQNKTNYIKSHSFTGDFVVCNSGKAKMQLLRRPKTAMVCFTDDYIQTPCNTFIDDVEYSIVREHGQIFIIIQWKVSAIRKIQCTVNY